MSKTKFRDPNRNSDAEKVDLICEKVALENSINPSTARDIHTKVWQAVKSFMSSEETPRIVIRNFGTFIPNSTNIENQIKSNEELIDESKREDETERLKKIKERITKEHSSRKHGKRKPSEVQGTCEQSDELS